VKKLIYVLIGISAVLCFGAKSLTGVNVTEGNILQSVQTGWAILESENFADTQTDALADTERTKKKVEALIAANANEEAYISIFEIPSSWNAVRLRALAITDGGSLVHEIYLGTRGGTDDCEISYAGSLAWTAGTQTSTYSQITFTSGGTYEPITGDKITGNTSGETAIIVSLSALSGGAWADGNAAGTITYRSDSGTFTGSETVTISRNLNNETLDGFTHAATDLIRFELADTLTVTAKAWNSSWTTTSPADDTNAETEIDLSGSDFMVIVTTTCGADGKLMGKGF